MAFLNKQYTLSQLYQQLFERKLIEKVEQNATLTEKQMIIDFQERQLIPMYQLVMMAIGVFITTSCFVGFFSIFMPNEKHLLMPSFLLCVVAIGLHLNDPHNNSLKRQALVQVSFTCMALAKVLLFIAINIIFTHDDYRYWLVIPWAGPIALGISTLIIYPFYRVPLDRFLSCYVTLMAILFCLMGELDANKLTNVTQWVMICYLYLLSQLIIAGYLFYHLMSKPKYQLLFHVLICSMTTFILCYSLLSNHRPYFGLAQLNTHVIKGFLIVSFILLIIKIACRVHKLKSLPVLLACLGVLLLSSFCTEGILWSIMLLMIGYESRQRFIIIIGITLLPITLINYYYLLDTTLLTKSALLIGSGLLLLMTRWFMHHKGWDRLTSEEGITDAQ